MNTLKKIMKWTIACIAMLYVLFLVIHLMFINKKFEIAIPNDSKMWIHRGLYDNKLVFENSIDAFDSAQKKGFKGVELDVFYIDSLNDFVVSHNLPNPYSLPQLLLSDVLNRYSTTFYYWLDLKNLSTSNKIKIKERLEKILTKSMKDKLYIESDQHTELGFLAENGFNTLYWIQYNRENAIKKYLKKLWIKYLFVRYNFKGASIGVSMADQDFFKSFETVPQFIFHIYSPELYNSISKQKNIAVFLIDYVPKEK